MAKDVHQCYFDTAGVNGRLRSAAVGGGRAMVAGQVVGQILQLAATAVLARLVTPGDYGLLAMITAVTGIILIFGDLGLSVATVQREKITHEQVSLLFWVNMAASAGFAVVAAASAPLLVWFYDEPRLLTPALLLAPTFLLHGLAVQHEALLRRQMRFHRLVSLNVGRIVFSSLVGIAAAWYGAGLWALVWMQLAAAAFRAVAVWTACRWRPGRPRRVDHMGELLSIGGNFTAFSVVNYLSRKIDSILVGRCFGENALGMYDKAYALMMLPMLQLHAPMSAVAVAALSRLQDDAERFERYYLRALGTLAFFSLPLGLLMVVLADEVVAVLLGTQWGRSAELLQVLAPAVLLAPIFGTTGWLFVSMGRTDRMVVYGVISAAVTITAFAVGVNFGVTGVAGAYSTALAVLVGPGLWYAARGTRITLRAITLALWRPAVAAAAAALVAAVMRYHLPKTWPAILTLTATVPTAAAAYLGAICLLGRGTEPIRDIWQLLRHR